MQRGHGGPAEAEGGDARDLRARVAAGDALVQHRVQAEHAARVAAATHGRAELVRPLVLGVALLPRQHSGHGLLQELLEFRAGSAQ